ncbi:MAG: PhoU domain-containing protein [Thermoplasmata archaeon]
MSERKSKGGPAGERSVPAPPSEEESTRSLQRMGPVSLGVSLPRAWVAGHGLRVGSPVRLRPLPDGSLRVGAAGSEAAEGRVVIEVGSAALPEHLFRELLGAYLGGAVEFEVHEADGLSAATQAVLRTFVRRTIQPEVVAEDARTAHLRDVSRSNPVPLPRLVARMGELVRALQEDAGRSFRSGPAAPPLDLAERDDEVDRQGWFIERILVRTGAETAADPGAGSPSEGPGPLGYFIIARSLERIADHAVTIAEVGGQLAEMSPPEEQLRLIEQFHGQARQHLASALELLRSSDRRRANELLDLGEALHATYRALDDRLFPPAGPSGVGPTQAALLARLLQSVDRSVAYAQDLTEVALTQGGRPSTGRAGPAPRARPRESPRAEPPVPPIASASRRSGGGRPEPVGRRIGLPTFVRIP